MREKEMETTDMGTVTSIMWGVRWVSGQMSGWYMQGDRAATGTESEARDKAARLNDKDVDGRTYRAERMCKAPT